MEKLCANNNCADNENAELLDCKGLCGKSFHPICTGISKRSAIYIKDFRNNFLFFCDECKELSLSHVLLAIKCHNDSTNLLLNDLKLSSKKVLSQFAKFDEVIKTVDELANTVESLSELSKSKFKIIEKQLAAVSESVLKKPRDVLSKSHLNTELTRFMVPISTLNTQVDNLKLYLRESIRGDLQVIRDSMTSHSVQIGSLSANTTSQTDRIEEVNNNPSETNRPPLN